MTLTTIICLIPTGIILALVLFAAISSWLKWPNKIQTLFYTLNEHPIPPSFAQAGIRMRVPSAGEFTQAEIDREVKAIKEVEEKKKPKNRFDLIDEE